MLPEGAPGFGVATGRRRPPDGESGVAGLRRIGGGECVPRADVGLRGPHGSASGGLSWEQTLEGERLRVRGMREFG